MPLRAVPLRCVAILLLTPAPAAHGSGRRLLRLRDDTAPARHPAADKQDAAGSATDDAEVNRTAAGNSSSTDIEQSSETAGGRGGAGSEAGGKADSETSATATSASAASAKADSGKAGSGKADSDKADSSTADNGRAGGQASAKLGNNSAGAGNSTLAPAAADGAAVADAGGNGSTAGSAASAANATAPLGQAPAATDESHSRGTGKEVPASAAATGGAAPAKAANGTGSAAAPASADEASGAGAADPSADAAAKGADEANGTEAHGPPANATAKGADELNGTVARGPPANATAKGADEANGTEAHDPSANATAKSADESNGTEAHDPSANATAKSADEANGTEAHDPSANGTEAHDPPANATVKYAWLQRAGYNCYDDHGASAVPGTTDDAEGKYSLAECQKKCEGRPECEAIVVPGWEPKGECLQRMGVRLSKCARNTGYHLWQRIPASPVPPEGVWESFGKGTVCRLHEDDDSEDSDGEVLVYGAASLELCKGLCGTGGDTCYGIEYMEESQRCEVWTEPVNYVKPREGFECYAYQPPEYIRPGHSVNGVVW